MTFNFAANTAHLADQDYSICIRREEGMCCVEYQVCSDALSMSLSWQLDGMATQGSACAEDYVRIEDSGATCTTNLRHNKYCGTLLSGFAEAAKNSPVCDCT